MVSLFAYQKKDGNISSLAILPLPISNLATITEPEIILDGNEGALMATRTLETGRVLVVVYKEISNNDGFVITAFPTRRLNSLTRRTQSWP